MALAGTRTIPVKRLKEATRGREQIRHIETLHTFCDFSILYWNSVPFIWGCGHTPTPEHPCLSLPQISLWLRPSPRHRFCHLFWLNVFPYSFFLRFNFGRILPHSPASLRTNHSHSVTCFLEPLTFLYRIIINSHCCFPLFFCFFVYPLSFCSDNAAQTCSYIVSSAKRIELIALCIDVLLLQHPNVCVFLYIILHDSGPLTAAWRVRHESWRACVSYF